MVQARRHTVQGPGQRCHRAYTQACVGFVVISWCGHQSDEAFAVVSYLVKLLEDIAADCSLDAAYEWLCNRRKHYPEKADVWSIRFNRFMDDFIVLTTTRWKLKRAVKAVNQRLNALKLEKHPDKTFIGRIDKGVDFLGYHFSPNELHTCCLRYRQPLGLT
jgi:hypothetical protein